jgi:hypothetical protein
MEVSVSSAESFPQTIEIAAPALDVVEWLERNSEGFWFVGNDKHAAYLSWIEDGPMGMAIGSYIPGPSPVKIAFEGYVTIEEGEPGVLLPFNPMEVDPESQFRELEGLFFVTVQPVDMHNCVLIAEVQDAEPMLVDRVIELIKDLVNFYQMRRVADARRRARDSVAAAFSETKTPVSPTGAQEHPPAGATPADAMPASGVPDFDLADLAAIQEELRFEPGRKATVLDYKVAVVLGAMAARRRRMAQKKYCDFIPSPYDTEKSLAYSTLSGWKEQAEVLSRIAEYKSRLGEEKFLQECDKYYRQFTGQEKRGR